VLDLGAGRGVVTGELVRRAGGPVVALDRRARALTEARTEAARVGGDVRRLPFAGGSFDLVFSQLTLLWITPLQRALDEIHRVLSPGGVLIALEPDYGGMIEHPPEIATRDLWLAALRRADADPFVGRTLPRLLSDQGFAVRVDLFNRLTEPDSARFDLLRGLPLTSEERADLARIEAVSESRRPPDAPGWAEVVHLPFFLITAKK
jgi:SAM-dependent methyltransferase